jgi:hypothetical protein
MPAFQAQATIFVLVDTERFANNNAKNPLSWGCSDFRHTLGGQLAMRGESVYKTPTLMGSSPEICRRRRAALLPETLIDSVGFHSHVTTPAKGTCHHDLS